MVHGDVRFLERVQHSEMHQRSRTASGQDERNRLARQAGGELSQARRPTVRVGANVVDAPIHPQIVPPDDLGLDRWLTVSTTSQETLNPGTAIAVGLLATSTTRSAAKAGVPPLPTRPCDHQHPVVVRLQALEPLGVTRLQTGDPQTGAKGGLQRSPDLLERGTLVQPHHRDDLRRGRSGWGSSGGLGRNRKATPRATAPITDGSLSVRSRKRWRLTRTTVLLPPGHHGARAGAVGQQSQLTERRFRMEIADQSRRAGELATFRPGRT